MTVLPRTADFLVIGGGVLGLSIGRELKRRNPRATVLLLEKEPEVGLHASGRNSGVLHAGFYYTADSLKARFTRQGNRELAAYCEAKSIPLNRCGKLVVAKGPEELGALDELLRRGRANGVALEMLSAEEARRIEPRLRTFERALYSPSTATTDPGRVLLAMKEDALAEGVGVLTNAAYQGRARDGRIRTAAGEVSAGHVVNAAGLYADTVARDFGFSERCRILPFKGLYLYSEEPPGSVRTNVYPVPDLNNPFLGVHFTVAADGRAKIGPTAIPALWREQYGGLERFSLPEFLEIARRDLGLLVSSGFDFKRLALEELLKCSRGRMAALASTLLEGVKPENYRRWGRPGIRAQLYDIKEKKLVMDFLVEGDSRSTHVLNAVSPGFTCALPFARHVCDEIRKRRGD